MQADHVTAPVAAFVGCFVSTSRLVDDLRFLCRTALLRPMLPGRYMRPELDVGTMQTLSARVARGSMAHD